MSTPTPLSLVERLRIIAGDVGVAYELVAQTDIDRDCLEAAARIVDLETELQAAREGMREECAVAAYAKLKEAPYLQREVSVAIRAIKP